MKRKERRQNFHESLLNMLYVPPSPPINQHKFDEQTLNLAQEIVNSDHHRINTDELEGEDERSFSASGEEEGELGFQKLTRAQRKRLRKKKLNEAASHRRQIIGPLLPDTSNDQIDDDGIDTPEHDQSQGVGRNAAEGPHTGNDQNHRRDTPSSIKVKHRRMSKKKATEKLKMVSTDQSDGAPSSGDKNETLA